ncbi:MAG: hypothetical protein KKF30_07555 [Proteobacteria bacterium]|nr:hypothetical protein [Pseudomonadota bacterium]MBU4470276.1 hypothetical protein [Pseudomonadota bacterium]MCG2752689.1 hypothetical protein [Desulfobacteraceae bacterium]
MIDIVLFRQGNIFVPFSDDDLSEALTLSESEALRAKISGAKKIRAYRELCAYKSSCDFIASHAFNENMDTKRKVDCMTKLKLGFTDGVIMDPNGNLHWIEKSLKYENCHQPEAHAFITKALEEHAALCGIFDVDQYLHGLRRAK